MRIGKREVRVTNPDKVFFPEPGLTKGDLIAYYVDVAGCVLHHVCRRPMHVSRFPQKATPDSSSVGLFCWDRPGTQTRASSELVSSSCRNVGHVGTSSSEATFGQ